MSFDRLLRGGDNTFPKRRRPLEKPPYLDVEDYLERAGPLPADLVSLHRFSVERKLEGAFKTLQIWLPRQEWGPPVDSEYCPILHAMFRDWNGIGAFGNLQIWERLGGLATLGTDSEGNRFFVGTLSEDAPVFWMDHEWERPGLHRLVAPSLVAFLETELGLAKSRAPKPEHHDYEARCAGIEDLLTWPPHLLARSEWLIELIAYGPPVEIPDAHRAADFAAEKAQISDNPALGLYWLLRGFLESNRDCFDEAAALSSDDATLQSAVSVLGSEWEQGDDGGRFCQARAWLWDQG